jgi:site-specific DNA-methyltransferase (adenine-specific)
MTRARLKNGLITLYRGDAAEIVPTLRRNINTVITDPPYGISYNNDFTRFRPSRTPKFNEARFAARPQGRNVNHGPQIAGDDLSFDPGPWLGFQNVVLFGANCYSDRLPIGAWFIWCKRRANALGKFCGDAEVAWHNRGHGVYLFHHVWSGCDRETERGRSLHPHQKPVALFSWVLSRLRNVSCVLDPYAGTSPIGEACLIAGIPYVGIEIDPTYYNLATERIRAA